MRTSSCHSVLNCLARCLLSFFFQDTGKRRRNNDLRTVFAQAEKRQIVIILDHILDRIGTHLGQVDIFDGLSVEAVKFALSEDRLRMIWAFLDETALLEIDVMKHHQDSQAQAFKYVCDQVRREHGERSQREGTVDEYLEVETGEVR